MFNFFKKLFGPGTDFKALKENGAIIIDVRSPQEFDRGNIKGSKNIPVNLIQREIGTIKNGVSLLLQFAKVGLEAGWLSQH